MAPLRGPQAADRPVASPTMKGAWERLKARDTLTPVALALDQEGRFLALRIDGRHAPKNKRIVLPFEYG